MHQSRLCPIISIFISLGGCGTYVPDLQDKPNEKGYEALLVAAINSSIKCDISNAVINFLNATKDSKAQGTKAFHDDFLRHWGAQVAISLTVEEKTTLNASVVGMPTSFFSIGGAGSVSSGALRNDKANFFFTVQELYDRGGCLTGQQPAQGAPSPLIQSDLRIGSWLFDQIPSVGEKEVSYSSSPAGVFKQNVLLAEAKFEVVTNGGLIPSAKLANVTVNQGGTFFSTSRDRTSDLTVTFGPLDPKQKNGALTLQAEAFHQAQQFGLAVQNNIRPNSYQFSILPF